MANLYYQEQLAAGAFEVGATLEISGDEARHAVRVSRLRVGEQILIGNGAGAISRCEVIQIERDCFFARVLDVDHQREATPRLVLVQALAKGDRDERAVEQATEFGVGAIVPWQAARSIVRWDGQSATEKSRKGVAKWSRIARESSKQSLRAHLPEVREPLNLDRLSSLAASEDIAVVALHPRGNGSLSTWAGSGLRSDVREIHVVVGPEGGLSDTEITSLEGAGAQVLTLGTNVLRTSSAGPAALAVLNIALGRW